MNARITLDIRLWSHPGIGRYIRELTQAMLKLRSPKDFHFLGYPRDLANLPTESSFTRISSKIYSLHEQWEMASCGQGLNLLHVPHFNIPVFRRGKLVVTIHDLTYLHDAKASKSKLGKPYVEFLFRQIQKKASAVLVVSEYTKNDLLNTFPGIRPDKVFVTYEAASPLFQKTPDEEALETVRQRYGLSKSFVLFVGSIKEHKNIPVLVRAVENIRADQKMDLELVLVGRRDLKNTALLRLIEENKSFVRYLGEVPDEELSGLYHLAKVFVLPSLREGFGLPVLEAMACGTPVLVSDRTCLPEIAGSAGLIFKADRVDELAGLLHKILTDEALRKNLSAKGLARAAEFSWQGAAEKTLKVYDSLLG